MDSFEATKLVLSRIQTLEPDHASKILGFLLLHDNGDQEIIRLALGPESLLHSAILKAKTSFGFLLPSSSSSSNPPTRPTSLQIPTHCSSDGGELQLLDDLRFRDQLAFLNDSSKPEESVDFPLLNHRRSLSVPGGCFGSDPDANSGLGWRPCSYFARGFCKNGSTCSFLHRGGSELATSLPHDKCLNLFLQEQSESQRSPRNELHRLGRLRLDRSELYGVNASSRQIYLTFPADSTFREEDVSNYFSIYGPVQDVRIPYQQKRMFGFVTFLYPETVKLILAKGNPHFVCDSRVLVKPYKEKAKVQEKKQQQQQQQQQQLCSSPTGIDSRESLDLYLGTRMFYNHPEMLLRRKLEEQADLQQAIELQSRRLLNLKLLNINNHHHHENAGFSAGSPIPSPTFSPSPRNHSLIFPVDGIDQEVFPEGGSGCSKVGFSPKAFADDSHKHGLNGSFKKDEQFTTEENDFLESLEHILPDNLFASPKKKAAGDYPTLFSTKFLEVDDKSTSPIAYFPDNSASFNSSTGVAVAPPKSCIPQLPRSIGEHIQRVKSSSSCTANTNL